MNPKEINLLCNRCNFSWPYTGDKIPNPDYPVWVSCPRCKTSVRLENSE